MSKEHDLSPSPGTLYESTREDVIDMIHDIEIEKQLPELLDHEGPDEDYRIILLRLHKKSGSHTH